MLPDARVKVIIYWLKHSLKLKIKHFIPISGDASFRRYFRVIHSHGQHIVMDAPPTKENIKPFIRVAALFKQSGVKVPEIFYQEIKQGFLLLEDMGLSCYLDKLNNKNASYLYYQAFASLLKIQTKILATRSKLPDYSTTLLSQELTLFADWFVKRYLSQSLPKNIQINLYEFLLASALEQKQVCVHRDFHSRNLMFLAENSPGIIDFQDAVIGPITYDLVSLLRDCYITWSETKVEQWVEYYFQQATKLGLINVSNKIFIRWFDLMGLQRHLKIIGIFTRLHLRDNKSNYLVYIPRAINYITLVCDKYPELTEFNKFFKQTILSVYQNIKQDRQA